MPDSMTSRQRLLTALRRGQPDRVPVTTYEIDPWQAPDAAARGIRYHGLHWHAQDPSYARVIPALRELQDTIRFLPIDSGLFHSAPGSVPAEVRTWSEAGSTYRETSIATPLGRPVRSVYRRDPDMHTSWQIRHFVEDEADLEALAALLSSPFEPSRPDLAQADLQEAELGERGLTLFSLSDALGAVHGLIAFEPLALWSGTAEGRRRIHRLLDAMQERIYRMVEHLAAHSSDRIFRFCGPEAAGPTLMPPACFREYVVDYLPELLRLVKRSGNFAVIHCHARLDAILEMIGEMEPDALEPIECIPAAEGDVTLADVKRRIGARVCLMGGIQGPDIDTKSPDEVEALVRQAIAEGAPGGGYVVLPSSMPVDPIPPAIAENIVRYVEAGREYGAYP